MREKELIIYRDFEDGGLLSDMVQLMESFKGREENRMVLYRCMMAANRGARCITPGFVSGFAIWRCGWHRAVPRKK